MFAAWLARGWPLSAVRCSPLALVRFAVVRLADGCWALRGSGFAVRAGFGSRSAARLAGDLRTFPLVVAAAVPRHAGGVCLVRAGV